MKNGFKQLDAILRGDATRLSNLERGEIPVSARGLTAVVILLGVLYGLCMGSFAVVRATLGDVGPDVPAAQDAGGQLVAAAVKLPLLFLLTLAVTLPSLYVFNALVGSRLRPRAVMRLLVSMLAVMLAVIASLGPIVAFFGLSTTSYPFMKLLNVAVCAVGGCLGLAFLLRTMHRIVLVQEAEDAGGSGGSSDPAAPAEVAEGKADASGTVSTLAAVKHPGERRARSVFTLWLFVFALVGAQMAWVLRPFIGDPERPFEWLRSRESNFFLDVMQAIGQLLGY